MSVSVVAVLLYDRKVLFDVLRGSVFQCLWSHVFKNSVTDLSQALGPGQSRDSFQVNFWHMFMHINNELNCMN